MNKIFRTEQKGYPLWKSVLSRLLVSCGKPISKGPCCLCGTSRYFAGSLCPCHQDGGNIMNKPTNANFLTREICRIWDHVLLTKTRLFTRPLWKRKIQFRLQTNPDTPNRQ